jgi:hypothetical protein
MIDIHLYCQGYGNSKGLAIIQDFKAHWAIKNEEMANVRTFNIESQSSQLEWMMFPYDSDNESNFPKFTMLIFYHSVSCKILDNSQPFITFISL